MTGEASELRIKRLRLQAQGLDEGAGRRLAQLVAENLAGDLRLRVGSASLATLSLEVTDRPGEPIDETARRVADAIRSAVGGSGSWLR